MVQYRYARGVDGEIYDVEQLDDATRSSGAPYTCIGCSQQLIPNIGKIKSNYFSHKAGASCSWETYLHRTAKLAFFNNYCSRLSKGLPYYLNVTRPTRCTRFQDVLGMECKGKIEERVDLTKIYTEAVLEEKSDEFRPDVTLISKRTSPIFVEIAVTHGCSENKIRSGNKIVEVSVSSESDIDLLRTDAIEIGSEKVKIYNIKGKQKIGDICQGGCDEERTALIVYKSGKVRLTSGRPADIVEQGKNSTNIVSVGKWQGSHSGSIFFVNTVIDQFYKKVPIKSCIVCTHNGVDKNNKPVCLRLRKAVKTNDAAECGSFSPYESKEECEAAAKERASMMRRRTEAIIDGMISSYANRRLGRPLDAPKQSVSALVHCPICATDIITDSNSKVKLKCPNPECGHSFSTHT